MLKIIVEIGLNHLGSEERAWRMLHCALEAKVDAVTFQVREPKFYESGEPERRCLRPQFYAEAVTAAHEAGVQFGIAIADVSAVGEYDSLGLDFWKSLSWDFKNASLRSQLRNTGRKVLMATGLSAMDEIVEEGAKGGNIELIHTQLTQEIGEVNLAAIAEMRRLTGLPVAFGLHCSDHEVLKVALGFQPSALLFYLKEPGVPYLFDDEHAISMGDLARLVQSLRTLATAIGTGQKTAAKKPSWVVE